MTVALLLGALCGLGALVAHRSLFPPPVPLRAAIERLERRTRSADGGRVQTDAAGELSAVLGRRLAGWFGGAATTFGLRADAVATDLRLVGRTLEHHLGQKVLLGLFGLALPPLTGLLMALTGTAVGPGVPVVAGLVLAVVFFLVPDLILRGEADERRADFRHGLGSFLDLVVISLAGGAGVESALRDAASIGEGWSYAELRRALETTRLTGETPWAALTNLGADLGVPELAELSASVSLAGTEGAKVRESLAVKASSLREHALAEAEAEAQSSTERMALPVVLLFVGFLILIGYPAIDAVTTGV